MLHIPSLYIAASEGKGDGVFTGSEINKNDLIEICPIIVIPEDEVAKIHRTILHDYYFQHPNIDGGAYIALGYGSLYNHNSNPNAEVVFDSDDNQMQIHCLEKINAGEEILINYNGSSNAGVKIWFEEK